MKPEEIFTLSLPPSYRLLAVSDIHGSLDLFRELLVTARYRPGEDFLILAGDLCGKGPQDQETLRWMFRWVRETPRVHALAGNVDLWWAQETLTPQEQRSLAPELRWLCSLPIAIDTPDLLFVHAGVEPLPRWQDSDRELVLRQQHFYTVDHGVNKWVAAGHLPTRNYDDAEYGDGVLFCEARRTIALDGGNRVLLGGRLNALIVEKEPEAPPRFSQVWADAFPKLIAAQDRAGDWSGFVRVTYLHPQLEILERGPAFSRVRMLHSGETGLAKNELIHEVEGALCTWFHLSAFPPVRAGEQVSVIDGSCPGWLLIRNQAGQMGWVEQSISEVCQ